MRRPCVTIKNLRNEEWLRLHLQFKGLVLDFTPEALAVVKLFQLYSAEVDTADLLLKIVQKSDYTRKMQAADKELDNVCRGFYTAVKAAKRQPGEDKQDAAMRLANMLEGYKHSIFDRSYAEESATIHNLLQDLRGAYAADMTLLGLTEWVDFIDQAEQRFISFYDERIDENFAKPQKKVKDVRIEVDTLYSNMANVLNATLTGDGLGGDIVLDIDDPESGETPGGGGGPVEESAPVARATSGNVTYDFVSKWNQVLKGYRNLLHQRAGRKAKSPDDEENDDHDSWPVEE